MCHENLCHLQKAASLFICLSCLCQTFARSWLYVRKKGGRPAAWEKIQIDQISSALQLVSHPSLSHPPNLSAHLSRPLLPVSDEVNRNTLTTIITTVIVNISTYVYWFISVLFIGDGLTGTPLTTSARISALNIVGELLRKVGVRH